MYDDKQLTCIECGATFTFSALDQERHAQRGFTNEPKRCAPCRAARKATAPARGGGGGGGGGGYGARPPRESHPAICAQCGKPTTVPFKPRGDRPVYCSDCFSSKR